MTSTVPIWMIGVHVYVGSVLITVNTLSGCSCVPLEPLLCGIQWQNTIDTAWLLVRM